MVLKNRPDMKFVFMGEGDMRSACERRARELNVGDSLQVPGLYLNLRKRRGDERL